MNKLLNIANHPIHIIMPRKYGITHYNFRIYSYVAGTYSKEIIFEDIKLPKERLDEAWLLKKIGSLEADQNLLFLSKVDTLIGERHFPLIDGQGAFDLASFDSSAMGKKGALSPSVPIGPTPQNKMDIFSSGRSYHGYGDILLTQDEFFKYMGNLLLIENKSKVPLVDHRWVGHQLKRGFAALRWSCNGTQYLQYPEYLLTVTNRNRF